MADRYAQRWDDDERRPPYESRYRERDWGYGGRSDRAFFERFLDELRSWFGDEEAQHEPVEPGVCIPIDQAVVIAGRVVPKVGELR